MVKWFVTLSITANDRSVSVIMAKWIVSHSQQLFCLLLWPNGSLLTANYRSVYYYGQMVRHSQPTTVLCPLLWSSGSSVTANDRTCTNGSSVTANDRCVSAIMAKWFVTHSQQLFCVYYYGQMVRQSQPTIVLSIIMAKWFVSRSQQ